MATVRKIEILALGGVNIDLVLSVPNLPARDEKVPAQFLGRFPGGPVGNFACAASRYGARVSAVCVVGNDISGKLIVEDFQRFKVDTTHVQIRPGYETPFTVIAIDPSGERAIIVPEFSDNVASMEVIPFLPQTCALYTMPGQVDDFLAIATAARAQGVEVMIDIEPNLGLQRADLNRILKVTSIASFNQRGFEAATGQCPSFIAARALLDLGPHTILVTRGDKGALAVTRSDQAEVPAFSVPIIDTTGAGDVFNAGFLTSALAGLSLFECLRFANAGSALAIGCLGSRGCLAEKKTVNAFLEQEKHKINIKHMEIGNV
jgi:sulfofructose kinase